MRKSISMSPKLAEEVKAAAVDREISFAAMVRVLLKKGLAAICLLLVLPAGAQERDPSEIPPKAEAYDGPVTVSSIAESLAVYDDWPKGKKCYHDDADCVTIRARCGPDQIWFGGSCREECEPDQILAPCWFWAEADVNRAPEAPKAGVDYWLPKHTETDIEQVEPAELLEAGYRLRRIALVVPRAAVREEAASSDSVQFGSGADYSVPGVETSRAYLKALVSTEAIGPLEFKVEGSFDLNTCGTPELVAARAAGEGGVGACRIDLHESGLADPVCELYAYALRGSEVGEYVPLPISWAASPSSVKVHLRAGETLVGLRREGTALETMHVFGVCRERATWATLTAGHTNCFQDRCAVIGERFDTAMAMDDHPVAADSGASAGDHSVALGQGVHSQRGCVIYGRQREPSAWLQVCPGHPAWVYWCSEPTRTEDVPLKCGPGVDVTHNLLRALGVLVSSR